MKHIELELMEYMYLALIKKVGEVEGTSEEKILLLAQMKNSLKSNVKELLKKI
jgi:hypothetical protein